MPTVAALAAIEFASPAMLGWLAAASIPWLINLWSRRRHTETSWAAVELLMAAVRERSRRIRLRELLLLALRSSILLLLALAAARPLWRSPSLAAHGLAARTHHVLITDRSLSMATSLDDGSRLDRAKARARQLIEAAPAGDAFTMIAWGETADNILGRAAFDPAEALAAVDSIEISETVAELGGAIRAAKAAIKSTSNEFPGLAQTQCIFLTDLSVNSWAAARASPSQTTETKADAAWTALRSRAAVFVDHIDPANRNNCAIIDIFVDPAALLPNQPVTVAVTAQKFGNGGSNTTDVQLLIDGNPVAQRTATLTPGAEEIARFELPALSLGHHVFEARLTIDDGLDLDNRRWLAVNVAAAPRVLCIGETDAATADIARALNPHALSAAADPGSPQGIHVERGSPDSITTADLNGYDAVFLANVGSLSHREERLLDRYVASGGAVAIFLGDRSQPAAYNRFLNLQGESGASATASSTRGIQIADQADSGDFRLDPLGYRHPILAPFSGRNRAGLLSVRVSRYYPVRFNGEQSGGAPSATQVLAYSSGDPAIFLMARGSGQIAVVTTDPAIGAGNEPWSTLAVSPSFVPLVRELFAEIAVHRRGGDLNQLVGEPLSVPRAASQLSWQMLSWKEPGGQTSSAPPEALRSGVYTIEHADAPAIPIAVNVDPRESDLTSLDASDVLNADRSRTSLSRWSAVEFASAAPLHSYALALALSLVLVELMVAWLLGRGRA